MEYFRNRRVEIMEKRFFKDGNFVILKFLEELVSAKSRNITVEELLRNTNLLGCEQYLVNPSLLIGCLYGTFLLNREQIKEKENEISQVLKESFTVIQNEEKKPLTVAIRNALAHYNIDMRQEENGWWIVIFKDRNPRETHFHFVAEISLLQLRILIERLSKLI